MLNTVYRFQTSAWRSSRAGESGRKHSPASSCFGKWSSVVSRYPQPALQKSRRITIYDVVSCCNMQLLDLDLRPMCSCSISICAQCAISCCKPMRWCRMSGMLRRSSRSTPAFPASTLDSGRRSPQRALSGKDKYSYFVVSTGVSSTARSRLPWSNRSVTSVASLL